MSTLQRQSRTAMDPVLPQTETMPTSEIQTRPGLNSGKKILLVDDEADILKLIETFLRVSGFTVNSFCSGFDAIQSFVDQQHDLVLTDINMPGLSGIILADYIKSQNSEIPVFAITGSHFLAEDLFDEVIKKPLDLKVLLQLIQAYFMEDSLHA